MDAGRRRGWDKLSFYYRLVLGRGTKEERSEERSDRSKQSSAKWSCLGLVQPGVDWRPLRGQDGDFTPFLLGAHRWGAFASTLDQGRREVVFSTGKTTTEPKGELFLPLSGRSGRNQRQLVGTNGKRRRESTERSARQKRKPKMAAGERRYERQTKREMAGANGRSMTGPRRALGR